MISGCLKGMYPMGTVQDGEDERSCVEFGEVGAYNLRSTEWCFAHMQIDSNELALPHVDKRL